MINVTVDGKYAFQNAVQSIPATITLFTGDGELSGYGYEPIKLSSTEWDSQGRYPEVMWTFSAEKEPANVLGYAVNDISGNTLFSESFDKPYIIQNNGDRIGVALTLNFIGALGS